MTLRGPVLVGTDLSELSEEALRQAAQLAEALGDKLIVCHIIPELVPDDALFADFRGMHRSLQETVHGKARAAVQAQMDSVLGDARSGRDVLIESGTPHAGLLAQSEHTRAGVVVVGPGSVGLNVVRHATSAVMVARRSPKGPVIAATDFSDPSLPGLELAAFEARRRNAALHLLHAFDIGLFALGTATAPEAALPYLAGSSPIALEGLDELRAVAKERLLRMLEQAGLPGEAVVLPGPAAHVIVRYAESMAAELVVVGTHGRSGLARLTLGSTAAAVIESAPCSVLAFRLST
jgi:nucleotide-binding universal stress UspA family protein